MKSLQFEGSSEEGDPDWFVIDPHEKQFYGVELLGSLNIEGTEIDLPGAVAIGRSLCYREVEYTETDLSIAHNDLVKPLEFKDSLLLPPDVLIHKDLGLFMKYFSIGKIVEGPARQWLWRLPGKLMMTPPVLTIDY